MSRSWKGSAWKGWSGRDWRAREWERFAIQFFGGKGHSQHWRCSFGEKGRGEGAGEKTHLERRPVLQLVLGEIADAAAGEADL